MALRKRGKYVYGDTQADLRAEVLRYSTLNYVAEHFSDAMCACGGRRFWLAVEDTVRAAVRTCPVCRSEHPLGDSGEYLTDASLEECACPCGAEEFEITVGVALYSGTDAVRWLYLGCRCCKYGLVAVYADWKTEVDGYKDLLARV